MKKGKSHCSYSLIKLEEIQGKACEVFKLRISEHEDGL